MFEKVEIAYLARLLNFVDLGAKPFGIIEPKSFLNVLTLFIEHQYTHDGCSSTSLAMITMHSYNTLPIL